MSGSACEDRASQVSTPHRLRKKGSRTAGRARALGEVGLALGARCCCCCGGGGAGSAAVCCAESSSSSMGMQCCGGLRRFFGAGASFGAALRPALFWRAALGVRGRLRDCCCDPSSPSRLGLLLWFTTNRGQRNAIAAGGKSDRMNVPLGAVRGKDHRPDAAPNAAGTQVKTTFQSGR